MTSRQALLVAAQHRIEFWADGTSVRYRARLGAVDGALKRVIRDRKEEWVSMLRAREGEHAIVAPLSHGQRAQWFLQQLRPGSSAYNVAVGVLFRGGCNENALADAVRIVVQRHGALRTTYGVIAGEPVQCIWQAEGIRTDGLLCLLDTSHSLRSEAELFAQRPFDLAREPGFRVSLIRDRSARQMLVLSIHHANIDGWSLPLLVEELLTCYGQIGNGSTLNQSTPEFDPIDYVLWQEGMLAGISGEALWTYWRSRLSNPRAPTELPVDKGRGRVQGYSGATRTTRLDVATTAHVKHCARTFGVTVNTVVLSALAVLLQRYTGERELMFGCVASGRTQPEHDRLIAYLANPVVICPTIVPEHSFRNVIESLHAELVGALQHQDYPFPLLVERLAPVRDAGRNPLFQILFDAVSVPSWASSPADWGELGKQIELVEIPQQEGQFDIVLVVSELGGELCLSFKYDSSLFRPELIEQFSAHYSRLIEVATSCPQREVAQLEILSAEERDHVISRWNDTSAPYPHDQCVHELFEAQVARTPFGVAIVHGGQRLSYNELNARANRVAHFLRSLGVKPDDRVGIYAERSVAMVVGILAVLKAGAAYVPLDPQHPVERLRHVLAESEPLAVLTDGNLAEGVIEGFPLLDLNRPLDNQPDTNLDPGEMGLTSRHLAYVIYTSGSTGLPKGVMIEHRSLVNHMTWMQTAYPLGPDDPLVQKTPFGFDASVWEFFAPLLCGSRLVVADPGIHRDAQALALLLLEEHVHTLQVTPTLLSLLLETPTFAACIRLKRVFCGGEALPADLVDRFRSRLPEAELINLYGPTEATIDATFWNCRPGTSVTIGHPIANTQIYILDEQQQLVPVGVVGELYIGGVGVARGYWRRPDLTAERFFTDRFSSRPDARLYRTGDLGRWRRDGSIEYLGRNDSQVKIRGFRIELGEIEARLLEHPQIRDAVVVAREDTPGEPRLVGYVASEYALSVEAMRVHLLASLPDYMVPSAFVRMDSLPVTPHGKVDRNALPAPDGEAHATRSYEAPQGEVERGLATIWSDLLKVERVGRRDNFFDLGGHSLLAMRMLSRARLQLNVEASVRELFANPVLCEFASMVRQATVMGPLSIPAVGRGGPLPLSLGQRRLWFLSQIARGKQAYAMAGNVRLRGLLDRRALRRALDRVVFRHEALRTRFVQIDGEPAQSIAPDEVGMPIQEHDLPDRARLPALIQEEANTAFDLEHAPLIRARLVRLADQEHVLMLSMHHIACDGWSLGILLAELNTLYSAYREGKSDPLPPLAIQYADYAVWQRERLRGEELKRQSEYWKAALEGAPTLLSLPADHPRPPEQDYAGDKVEVELERGLCDSLKAMSERHGTTLYMTLLSGWAVLLARLAGQDEVVIGSPVAGRTHFETEPLVGFFVNTLAIRLKLHGGPSVAEVLKRTKSQVLEAQEHQDLPFEQVVELVQPQRSLAYTPLFQAMFAWQNTPPWELSLPGLELSSLVPSGMMAAFDVTLDLRDTDTGIRGALIYATALFDRGTAERHVSCLRNVLRAMVTDDSQQIWRLAWMSEVERHQVLFEWNKTAAAYPGDRCVHELFEEQVERTPEALALVGEQSNLTYRELNVRANQLAHHLRGLGVRAGALVGLCMDRGPQLVISLLATLKAGGAYVPFDPAYPRERLRFMLQDSDPAVVLVDQTGRDALSTSCHSPVVDLKAVCLDRLPAANLTASAVGLTPRHLAYVIYTSGSTGVPKGVMNEHRGVSNLARAQQLQWRLSPGDRVLQFASFSFDASVSEVFMALGNGASLHLTPRADLMPGRALSSTLTQHRITHVTLPPSVLSLCDESSFPSTITTVIVAGEPLTLELANRWSSRVALFDAYGPTETAVCATMGRCAPESKLVTIGRPIANMRVYILDAYQQPVPIGVTGELVIGGVGVARGYLNRPALTSERFLPDPWGADPEATMYKTGDLGRWRPDGTIEFVGRNDLQVKVRGHRIELGEIEARLASVDGVSDLVVTAQQDEAGEKRLVVYYAGPRAPEPDVLRYHARGALPEFMVPAAYVRLAALPLSHNGKVDLKALPAPRADDFVSRRFEAPHGATEEALAGIWKELLKIDRVGRNDNFFDLGGHSLLAVRLVERMRHVGLAGDIRTVYGTATLTDLATGLGAECSVTDEHDLATDVRSLEGLVAEVPRSTSRGPNEIREVLLTGATGFLGAFLLKDLLGHAHTRVRCLVRAPDVATARNRIDSNLRAYGLDEVASSERIEVLVGDLAAPRLGLPPHEWTALAEQIDSIVHNGALVNFVRPYADLRKPNVGGTAEILRLAAHAAACPIVHLVSTLSVFPDRARSRDEVDVGADHSGLEGGYALSKWAAERLALMARERGVAVTIYRPGRIAGHSRTGAWDRSDLFCLFIKACVVMQTVPDVDVWFDLTPVDYVSRAIASLVLAGQPDNGVYHLTNPMPVRASDLREWGVSLGYNLDRISTSDFLSRFTALISDDARHELSPLLAVLPRWLERRPFAADSAFSTARTLARLTPLGVRCPPADAQMLSTYLGHLQRLGFLPKPFTSFDEEPGRRTP